MSNKDRPGKSLAFYTDRETLNKLEELCKLEHRSTSNMLVVMINHYWTDAVRNGIVPDK